jgi:brefeldin A-inhibited guanine nucleotide-exchange protein
MESLYDRIVNNEIKMKADQPLVGPTGQKQVAVGWLDTIMNLLPGRQRAADDEPTEEAIRRTQEFLREKTNGAMFFQAKDGEAVRPMLDVAWAPMLGAFR